MSNVKTTCLRFNLDKPVYQKAWNILQTAEQSHSQLIAEALSEYSERHSRLDTDPYFETREREEKFVEQIVSGVERTLEKSIPVFLSGCMMNIMRPVSIPPDKPDTELNDEEIDLDFLGE